MRRRLPAAMIAILALAGGAAAAPAAVTLEPVGTFAAPVYVTAPADDPSRLAVVEQAGTVALLVDSVRQAAPMLDISARVLSGGERGLLSIAFAPDYAASGLVYAYYTARSPVGAVTISEFRRSGADPTRIDPASERILVQIPHDRQGNHNGGQLQIGPDGALYAGTGDGGASGDPAGNAQNTDTTTVPSTGGSPTVNRDWRLAKILRIDRATGSPSIYAFGVRNPFRFSFDRATGDMVIGDVGQNAYEEADLLPAGTTAGVNLGWNRYEGRHSYPGGAAVSSAPGVTFPALERPHSAGACSITGGYVVRDPGLPSLVGRYVYGDFCDAALRSVALTATTATGDGPIGVSVPSTSSFGEDACGRVYVTSLGGAVSRLSETPTTCATAAGPAARPTVHAAAAMRLRTRYARRQRALRTRRVSVAIACPVRCTIVARPTARAGKGKVYRLRSVTRTVRAGRFTRLRPRLGPVARRVLTRSRRAVYATVLVTARGTDASAGARTLRVRLVP